MGGEIIKPNYIEENKIQQRIDSLTSSCLPKHVFCAFKRRKIYNAINVIKKANKRELNYNETLLKNKLAKEAKERYEQEYRPQNFLSSIYNSIQSNILSSLKGFLELVKQNQLDEIYKYIDENGLPSSLLYNIIDFQQATGEKYVNLSPEGLLNHIGMRYKMNISAVISGSSPKAGKTLYNTLPRPFSPLYFDLIKMVAIILPQSKLKTFEEHLMHWYNHEIKDATYSLLNCNNKQSLNNIVSRIDTQIKNSLWVPRQIKYKDKQMEMYFKNKGFSNPELYQVIAHSYVKWKSDNGTNEHLIKNLTPNDIISGIKEGLESNLRVSKLHVRSGWTIFDSVSQRDSYMYNELVSVLKGLGGKVTPFDNRRIKIKACKKHIMKKYMINSDLVCKQATS